KFLGHVVNVQLIAVDVHAGFGRHEIRQVMKDCKDKEKKEMWIFLDEVNTSPDIGWFKELICDHSLDGVKISDQIKIIAGCNPYQPRIQNSEVMNLSDPSSKWMYRVVPLCDTMKEYVWPFGHCSNVLFFIQCRQLTKQIKDKFNNNAVIYKKIQQWELKIIRDIDASQRFLRKCLNFFYWLMQQYETILENDIQSSWTGRALNIALGLCYYFRLDKRGRTMYNNLMYQRKGRSFSELLNTEINNLSKSFKIPAK
ncbi:hypothetical protein RFI_38685, partial [Reticulomyxa filosa]